MRVRLERGPVLCEHCELATSMGTRTKGLLGRSGLELDQGLWIQPTNSIHMWFMRFAIDVVWANGEGEVLKLTRGIGPWKIAFCRGAKTALELAEGAIDACGVEVGDHLVLDR